jgi:hypothetical protein
MALHHVGKWLGRPVRTELEMAQAVWQRQPTEVISVFLARGLLRS